MFGTEIEASLGTKAFGRFYMLSGLAGAALTLVVNYSQVIPVIGASGAIYGVLAVYWVMFPNRLVYIYFLFPVKVKWMVPGMMILGFLFGGSNVAHFAHLGGAVFGLLYMKSNWRWNWLGSKITNLRYKRQSAKLGKGREQATEVMRRVDEILDKINEVGIENISKADRKFLEDASSELARKKE